MDNTFTIERIGEGGDGIARSDDGAAVFIPLTAPGDVVRAAIKKDHEGYWRGTLQEIVTRAKDRAEAPCQHYGRCGGCSLQHVTPEFYALWKRDVVIHTLEKAGVKADTVHDPIFVPPGTRRRAVFAFVKYGKNVTVGFNARRSHDVMAVPGCLVLDPAIVTLADRLKNYLPALTTAKNGDVMIQRVEGQIELSITAKLKDDLEFHETLAAMMTELSIARVNARSHDRQSYELLLEREPFIKSFGGLRVHLPPASFLQPSDQGEEILTSRVMEYAGNATHFADLFSGAGTFTGPLLTSGRVTAIDSAAPAIAALARAGAGKNLSTQTRNLFADPLSVKELGAFDVVVLDPPRAGAKEQAQTLTRSDVQRIIYVSCNVQSFARDAKMLQAGGYRVKHVQPVDQFTWSAHGEIVSLIGRD